MKSLTALLFLFLSYSTYCQIAEPHLQWVKEFEYTNEAAPSSVDVDNQGNIYITGMFNDTLITNSIFDTHDFEIFDNSDGFILKLNKYGEMQWMKHIMQNSNNSYINSQSVGSIKVNSQNELIIVGSFFSSFKIKGEPASVISSSNGEDDFYILKLDTNGDFIWVKRIGGNSGDGAGSIEIDSQDNIYIPGVFNSTVDFDPNAGSNSLSSLGGYSGPFQTVNDAFLLKLSTDGDFIWVRHLGSSESISAKSVTIDNNDNVYVIGTFIDTAYFDLPLSVELISHSTGVFKQDVFICKFNNNGDLSWVKQQGGDDHNNVSAIKVDNNGNVYTTGRFRGTTDFDPSSNTFFETAFGWDDIYVSKLDSDGNFVWVKTMLGNTGGDSGSTIDLDSENNIYISGFFGETVDFDPGINTHPLLTEFPNSMFLQKLDSDGNLIWVKKTDGFDGPGEFKMVNDNTFYYVSGYRNSISFGDFYSNVELVNDRALYIMKLKQGFSNIEDLSIINQYTVYPNPTNDILHFNFKEHHLIQVIDLKGEVILSSVGKTISLKQLVSGMYIIKIYNDKDELMTIKKVIKK